MPAWESAPVVNAVKPAWESAPVVNGPRKPFDRAAFMEQEQAQNTANQADSLRQFGKDFFTSAGETALSLGSQMLAVPAAGVAGAVSAPFVGADRAADIVNKVSGFAYTPRSDAGQQTAETIAKPFAYLADKADKAGQVVSDATGSPLLGTIANTALQGAPALVTKGARAPLVNAAKAAAKGVNSAVRATTSAGRAALKGEATAAESQATAAAAKTAETYATSRGLDWNALADSVKAKLTDIARSAGNLENLDPVALERYSRLQSLDPPVPATRGQILRNETELRKEGLASTQPEGQPIKDIHAAANQALLDNLENLKTQVAGVGKTAAKATNPEEAGAVVQGAARAKEAFSKRGYDALFKTARETEPDASAPIAPVTELLIGNPEIQHLGWVQSWLNKAAKVRAPEGGEPVAITDATLAELSDLRSQASAIARTGGKEGYYAGEVRNAIDAAMEAVPEGANAWRAANDAFRRHKLEFDDQAAVGKLVDNASRTDRAVALERTVESITNASLDGIRQIKRTLLTGGDEATRTAGRQAMREIRTSLMDKIIQDATKSVSTLPDGSPNLTAAALNQSLKRYGPQKLDEIFGPGTAKQLDKIMQATKDVKTAPPTADINSTTVAKMLTLLGKGLDKIPGGGLVTNTVRGVSKLNQLGESTRVTEKAKTVPLNDAVKQATKERAKNTRKQDLKKVPLSSLAIGAQQK